MDGYMYAINRLTGLHVWREALGGPSASSPLLSGGKVYVGAGLPENKLKVFDAFSGALLGSFPAPQPVDSAPAAYGQNVYFGANDGGVYAIDMVSLQAPAGWTPYPSAGSFRMNVVAAADGIIYALPGHDDKKLYLVNAVTGNEIAKSVALEEKNSWETFSSPAVGHGRVYFAGAIGDTGFESAGDNYLSAVDTETLVSVWGSSVSLGAISNMGSLSSPVMANDFIYTGTVDGRLVIVSSESILSDVLNLSSAAYSSPAVANGMVFIGAMDGRLSAFRAGKIAALSYPAPGAIVSGTVTVRGYFSNPLLAGYELQYAAAGGAWNVLVSSVTGVAASSAVLAEWYTGGLSNGEYELKLIVQETGTPSLDNTAVVTVRVNAAPLPPPVLNAADVPGDSGNRIQLDWSFSTSPGITAYRIYRDAGGGQERIASVGAGSQSYIDVSAATGNIYTYAVRAFDGWLESENSNSASAVSTNDTGDSAAPSAVTDLSTAAAAPGGALLVWTASGNDGDVGTPSHYVIKYTSVAGYDWTTFDSGTGLVSLTRDAEGPAGASEAEEVRWLMGGTTYYFAMKAADFIPNLSPLSNIATACATLDPVAPLPPYGLAAADTPGDDGNSISLSWTLSPDDGAGAGDVYGYKLYKRLQNSSYDLNAPYAELQRGTDHYTDSASTTNVKFYYALTSFDSTNNSPLSIEASGMAADNWRFFDASQGASVRLQDGARVDIQMNSASQNDNIMMSKLDPVTFQPLAGVKANTQVRATGLVYEIKFKNAATRLLKPALITLPYTDAAVAGVKQENLRLYTLSGGTWLMVNTSVPDPQAKKVSAEVNHFSLYAIMEYVPSGELLTKDEVYTYPNPAKGDVLIFKFRLADKADVEIDIYNIAGEKVARLEKQDCPAGLTSEIAWNIKRVASGVYEYRVKASGSSGSKSVIKRLAVIH